jgi:hypothetical protein
MIYKDYIYWDQNSTSYPKLPIITKIKDYNFNVRSVNIEESINEVKNSLEKVFQFPEGFDLYITNSATESLNVAVKTLKTYENINYIYASRYTHNSLYYPFSFYDSYKQINEVDTYKNNSVFLYTPEPNFYFEDNNSLLLNESTIINNINKNLNSSIVVDMSQMFSFEDIDNPYYLKNRLDIEKIINNNRAINIFIIINLHKKLRLQPGMSFLLHYYKKPSTYKIPIERLLFGGTGSDDTQYYKYSNFSAGTFNSYILKYFLDYYSPENFKKHLQENSFYKDYSYSKLDSQDFKIITEDLHSSFEKYCLYKNTLTIKSNDVTSFTMALDDYLMYKYNKPAIYRVGNFCSKFRFNKIANTDELIRISV